MSPVGSPDGTAQPARPTAERVETLAALAVVLVYVGLEIALGAGHRPWRDEAQAWLWAQSLSTPHQFLIIPGEGHPPLWYWLLRGLSLVFDFNQARYLSVGIAILNAVLLARLLRGQLPLLVVVLFSYIVLQYWGYYFRPYGLVFTALLTALLLERAKRSVAAAWIMALACGLHFFAGFLFGLWLLLQWHRRTPLAQLFGPAALALLFGCSALLSGLGNPAGTPTTTHLFDAIAYNLSWPMAWSFLRSWPAALAVIILLCVGLWRDRFALAALLAMTLLFAVGTAAVYGREPWHAAFMMMMAFMTFLLAAPQARNWALLILLALPAIAGISQIGQQLRQPAWQQRDLYAVVKTDAGPTFDSSRQLVAWPDYSLSTAAADHGMGYISGNNGTVLGPVDWRTRTEGQLDPVFVTLPTPYWLICSNCAPALAMIAGAKRTATELASADYGPDGLQHAYRID